MAEAQFKSSQRLLPPPLKLKLHCKDDKDTRNVELQAKTSKRIEVPVSNPRNKDLLDLDRDANWDAALEHMQERCRKEPCSSSAASRSSSTGKRHWSASKFRDEIIRRRGVQLLTGNIQRSTKAIPHHTKKAQHLHTSSPRIGTRTSWSH